MKCNLSGNKATASLHLDHLNGKVKDKRAPGIWYINSQANWIYKQMKQQAGRRSPPNNILCWIKCKSSKPRPSRIPATGEA